MKEKTSPMNGNLVEKDEHIGCEQVRRARKRWPYEHVNGVKLLYQWQGLGGECAYGYPIRVREDILRVGLDINAAEMGSNRRQ